MQTPFILNAAAEKKAFGYLLCLIYVVLIIETHAGITDNIISVWIKAIF